MVWTSNIGILAYWITFYLNGKVRHIFMKIEITEDNATVIIDAYKAFDHIFTQDIIWKMYSSGKKMEDGQEDLCKWYWQFNDHPFTEGQLETYLYVLMKKHIPECTDDKTLDDSLMAVTTTGDIPKVYW